MVGTGSEKFHVVEIQRGFRRINDTSPLCYVTNYHSLVEVVPAKDAVSQTCDITLDPGRTLTGNVVGPDNKPLSGAPLGGVEGLTYQIWSDTIQPTAEFTVYGVKAGERRYVLAMHEEKQLASQAFQSIAKRYSYHESGGAPLLGVDGICMICHGSSNSRSIHNALRRAVAFEKRRINPQIAAELAEAPALS